MDDLRDLPDDDYDLSQDETEALDEYFPEHSGRSSNTKKTPKKSKGTNWIYLLKVTLVVLVLLTVLAFKNYIPMSDKIFANNYTTVSVLAGLFFIIFFFMQRYMA